MRPLQLVNYSFRTDFVGLFKRQSCAKHIVETLGSCFSTFRAMASADGEGASQTHNDGHGETGPVVPDHRRAEDGPAPPAKRKTPPDDSDDPGSQAAGAQGEKKMSRRAFKRMKRVEANKKGMQLKKQRKKESGDDRNLNFTDENLKDAECYVENGLRKVYPYMFKFTTYAKGRWIGRKILDIFADEFKAYDVSTYAKAIDAGRVTVNGEKVTADYIFKSNDYVENTVHRHELPVTAERINVVTDTDKIVVIDKPSSIPIHPCGRYRHNSLTYIMAKELGYKNLRTIYRLDRLTSGIFIFCKADEETLRMQDQIKNRKVEKTYVARVVGEFPSDPVECTEPIDTLAFKIGLFKVGPRGKEASTKFELLNYNGETSVVLCKPRTGRTHQIRVHLQYLGYPIVNDPLYNTPVWGPNRGKGGDFGKSETELVQQLIQHHSKERFEVRLLSQDTASDNAAFNTQISDKSQPTSSSDASTTQQSPSDLSTSNTTTASPSRDIKLVGEDRPGFDASKVKVDALCEECTRIYVDPRPEELVLYLHALSYSGPGWKYETQLPDWAKEHWTPPADQQTD